MASIDGFDAIAAGAGGCDQVGRTSGGEAAAGHTGSTERTSDGNHGDGVGR